MDFLAELHYNPMRHAVYLESALRFESPPIFGRPGFVLTPGRGGEPMSPGRPFLRAGLALSHPEGVHPVSTAESTGCPSGIGLHTDCGGPGPTVSRGDRRLCRR